MRTLETIGITGAAGYIGSCVARLVQEAGYDVRLVDDFSSGDVREVSGSTVVEVDVRDRDALVETFDDVDAVLHLAAVSDVPSCTAEPDRAFSVNVEGTLNVAWLCRQRGLPLVFAGSVAVMGDPVRLPIDADHPRDPLNLYGRTKKMSEDDIRDLAEDAFPAIAFVMGNVVGSHVVDDRQVVNDSVITNFVDRALAGEPLEVYDPGTQSRDYVHVVDIADAYLSALDALADAEDGVTVYTLGSGEGASVVEVADIVVEAVGELRGHRPSVERVSNPRAGETLVEDFRLDTAPVRAALGFEPTHTVTDAVRELVNE
jgi:nucleoside-diphosphate-sugar epimerase